MPECRHSIRAKLADEPVFAVQTFVPLSHFLFATANFKEAYFSKGFLRDSNFDGADFSNAIVDRASFSGSSLKGAIFTNAVRAYVLVQYITQLFCSLHVSYLHAGPDGDFL